jgi:hypothetical protein
MLMEEHPAGYPEDWQEQGWCCKACAVRAWYSLGPELGREFLEART